MLALTCSLPVGAELRPPRVADAEELFGVIDSNRQRLRAWLPWVDAIASAEDEETFLRTAEKQAAEDVAFVCGIVVTGKVVGSVGVHPVDWTNRKAELGYWLGLDHEGKGLMTAACRAVTGYLFDEVGLNRAMIASATGNIRSRAVADRLGFVLEGVHREASWLHDHFVDLARYAVLKREWERRRREV